MRKDASAAGTYSSPACYLHQFEPARGRAGRRDIRIKRIYDAAKPSDGFRGAGRPALAAWHQQAARRSR